jgi:hypothetical protein
VPLSDAKELEGVRFEKMNNLTCIDLPFPVPGRTASRLRRCSVTVARLVQESPLESLAHHQSQGTRRTVLDLPRNRAPCGGRKQRENVRGRIFQYTGIADQSIDILHAQPKPDAVLLDRPTSVRSFLPRTIARRHI